MITVWPMGFLDRAACPEQKAVADWLAANGIDFSTLLIDAPIRDLAIRARRDPAEAAAKQAGPRTCTSLRSG